MTETVRLWVGVDSKRCSGHARCAAAAPEVFTLDDDGYSDIGESRAVPVEWEESALRGLPTCPELALFVVRDEPGTT